MSKIIHFLPDNTTGGGPVNVARLIKILGVNYSVYYWSKSSAKDKVLPGNCLGKNLPLKIMGLVLILKNISKDDVVFTHGRGMGVIIGIIAIILRLKTIHTFRGYTYRRYNGKIYSNILNYMLYLTELLLSRYRVNIAVSGAEFIEVEKRLRPLNLHKIYNPIITKDIQLKEKVRDIIFVGRRSRQKGYDRFLEIFAGQTGISFAWFGDSEGLDEGSKTINFAGGKVEPANQNILEEISRSKLLVCLSRWEGGSTVVIESLMIGVPVISIACQGIDEFIYQTGAGRIVSLESISEQIRSVLTNSEQYNTYQKNTNEIFSVINLSKIEEQYREIIDGY